MKKEDIRWTQRQKFQPAKLMSGLRHTRMGSTRKVIPSLAVLNMADLNYLKVTWKPCQSEFLPLKKVRFEKRPPSGALLCPTTSEEFSLYAKPKHLT